MDIRGRRIYSGNHIIVYSKLTYKLYRLWNCVIRETLSIEDVVINIVLFKLKGS